MAQSHFVPGFRPSDDALHFANSFPPGPTIRFGPFDPRIVGIGDASSGLCGGMCFFVRRRFATGGPVPATTTVPDNGSDLFQQLVREQVRSVRLGVVPMRFWRLASMNAADRAARTRDREWPQIKQALDDNKLTAIGLIRVAATNPFKLTGNHQVLAYGYEIGDDGSIRVHVYDPNHPNKNDVWVPIGGSGRQSTGEPVLGVVALD